MRKTFLLLALAIMMAGSNIMAQLPAGTQPTTIPTTAPAPALTPALMNKMLKMIASEGNDQKVAAKFANALGLTAAGENWLVRQIADIASDKIVHAFSINRGSDQDLVLYTAREDDFHIFRANRDGRSEEHTSELQSRQ